MRRFIPALIAAGCFVAAPAFAQSKTYTYNLNGAGVTAHGTISCTDYGTECDGNSMDGWMTDSSWGDTAAHAIEGITLDYGTTDIVSPLNQTNFSFIVDNGAGGLRGYNLSAALLTNPFTGNQSWGFELFRDGPNFANEDVVFVMSSGAVPETATWMMLVAGFGLLGAALRRRTRYASPSFG